MNSTIQFNMQMANVAFVIACIGVLFMIIDEIKYWKK